MTTKLVTAEVDINLLKPNTWNTNQVSLENQEKIKASLERFGMFRPVLARQTNTEKLEIVGGQHRWQVAKQLGYKTIPVVNLGLLDDKSAKEIGLVDNGRYGEDDTLMLAELLNSLGDTTDILSYMPYTNDELENIFLSSSIALDSLDIEDDDSHSLSLSDLPSKALQTHQIMRFKIPMEDSAFLQKLIEATMKSQGYVEEDSLSNAGNALIHLIRKVK